ncbi:TetR/AcrR family transcriptional regulator [Microbacterium sp. GXF7504]
MNEGIWILENEGRDALTIAAVCRRAKVAPTVIYRRVDGLSGLFWAIYDTRMQDVTQTYRSGLALAAELPAGSEARVEATVRAMTDTWEAHAAFLHPIVNYSTSDEALNRRGGRESLALVDLAADLLPAPVAGVNRDVSRMIHQECVFRAMYGDGWLSHEPEKYEAFVARVVRVAKRTLFPHP